MGRAEYRILGSINGLSSTRRNVSMPIVSNSDISIRGPDPIAFVGHQMSLLAFDDLPRRDQFLHALFLGDALGLVCLCDSLIDQLDTPIVDFACHEQSIPAHERAPKLPSGRGSLN
jgi:hypothetical protein